jgi:hypothetical protein
MVLGQVKCLLSVESSDKRNIIYHTVKQSCILTSTQNIVSH